MEGIDSNILIYAFDDSSRFHKVAVDFIEEKIQSTILGIAEFSLLEFHAVITDGRKVGMPLQPSEACAVIREFYESRSFAVLPCSQACLKMTIDEAHGFSEKRNDIYDFLIASTFATNGIINMYTLNTKDFKKFDFIQAINPFFKEDHETPTPGLTPTPTHPNTHTVNIPYGKQSINEKDVASVCSVLRSERITQGPRVPEFERAVADYCGAKYAVAVSSGTSALHLACLALGLGPGDVLWTSPITFAASANCALYCGAEVDFVDIDPDTYTMSLQALEKKLRVAQRAGELPKVVVPVDMCGQSCDMQAIHELSRRYGFYVIEDAAHALGGRYKSQPVGSCRYSDITVFSFHPVKSITTGEGGMAVTNDSGLAQGMELLRTHGISRGPGSGVRSPESGKRISDIGGWYYEQIELGYNYRMNDMQAALGVSQLERLDRFIAARREFAERYGRLLEGLPLSVQQQSKDCESAWHLYVIRLDLEKANSDRKQVFDYLREKGIGVHVHYIPVHLHPWYRRMGFELGMFPVAERYYQEALTLPLFPAMSEEEQDLVVEALEEILPTEHAE